MVVVAEILRPRGNKGEVLAISQTDVPKRLETLGSAQARLKSGEDVAVTIEEAWPHREFWVLKFAGVDSISAAEKFAGADLWVPPEQRGELPEGWFRSDLVGCEIVDASTGSKVGRVEGWQDFGGAPLIETTVDGREVLIPFAAALCRKVDLKSRVVELELPSGILEL